MSAHGLVDLVERRQQRATDAVEDDVGVTLQHRVEHAEASEHLALRRRLHRAEQLLRVLGEPLDRFGVGRVKVAEHLAQGIGVEVVRGDVFGGQAHQPLADPRHVPLRRVHDFVQCEVEVQIGGRERPRGLERVEVGGDERDRRRVGFRQWPVVPAERVLSKGAQHRSRLYTEQQRRELRQELRQHLGTEQAAGCSFECLRVLGVSLDFELERAVRPQDVAETTRQSLEHGAQRLFAAVDPAAAVEHFHARDESRRESGLDGDSGLRGAHELLE